MKQHFFKQKPIIRMNHTSILTMYDCIASAPSLEGEQGHNFWGVNYSKIAFNTIRKGSLLEFQNPNDGPVLQYCTYLQYIPTYQNIHLYSIISSKNLTLLIGLSEEIDSHSMAY